MRIRKVFGVMGFMAVAVFSIWVVLISPIRTESSDL
jgi:hypothetical protein